MVALDAEDDEIDRPDARGVGGRRDARHRLFVAAHDGDPVGVDLVDERQGDFDQDGVVSRLREARPEDRTHCARADDRDLHWHAIIQAYLSSVNQRPPASAPPSTISV